MLDSIYGIFFSACGRMQKIWRQMMGLMPNTFKRFLIAGVLNAIFSISAFALSIFAGMEVWAALIATLIAGIAFNFMTTGGYVFRQLSINRLPGFILCYLIVYILNLGSIKLLMQFFDNKIIAQAIITVPMGLLAYVLMARFVFLRRYEKRG